MTERQLGKRGKRTVRSLWPPLLSWLALSLGCADPSGVEVVIHRHDPAKVQPGLTYLQLVSGNVMCVTLEGEILWDHYVPTMYLNGANLGFDVLEEGDLLRFASGKRQILDPFAGDVLWQDGYMGGHHSLQEMPWGDILFLHQEPFPMGGSTWLGDEIVQVDAATRDVVWTWRLRDHLDPLEHHEDEAGVDWSHGNTVKFYPYYLFGGRFQQAVLFLSRNLHTLFMIGYPSGEVLWSLGQHGTFGRREPPEEPVFMQPHEADMVANNRLILYDNGVGRSPFVSRVREFWVVPELGILSEVWTWTDPDLPMADLWAGDANRLLNGNTLTVNVFGGRIVEVNAAGEKVWEMEIKQEGPAGRPLQVYRCERVPDVP